MGDFASVQHTDGLHPLHFPAILKENISKGCKEKSYDRLQTARQKLRRMPLLGLDYAAQLKQKEEKVRTLVGKIGPVRPIRGMQQPWHYRNKAIATFAPAPGGKVTTGIYAAGTHKVLPAEDCLLQDTVLNKTLLAVRQAANACRYAPFNEDKGTGLLRHCLVRRGGSPVR